jgi:DivIVA domain-containing protein
VLGVSIVLFVVLLAVLFAVAAVTAGFGDLMKPAFQDARPVGLPERQVTPDDIEALRLNVVLRGYKMADVDAVLHRLSRELAERDAVLAELRDGGRSRSFRPEPPPLPPYSELPTQLMAPYVDPDVVDLDVGPDVDTDEHAVVEDLDAPWGSPQEALPEERLSDEPRSEEPRSEESRPDETLSGETLSDEHRAVQTPPDPPPTQD